jgi:pSer/pThr/pTyr-binding forkhead associated (FHA) protein
LTFLVLRVAFVALLYLFLYRLVSTIRRDLRAAAPSPERSAPRQTTVPQGRLIVLHAGSTGLETGRAIPLGASTTLGRSSECDLRLADRQVSARHAALRHEDGAWFVIDLGSTNGTYLNQRRIAGEQPIAYGDLLDVGGVRLKLAP